MSRKNYPVSASESSQLEGPEARSGMVGEEEKPSLRRKPCRKPGWAAILPEERGCRPEWGLIFRGGKVYCRGYRQSLPERKERAFQEQQTKLVFIGSKLERSREASCGRFFRPFHRDSGIPPQQERKLGLKGADEERFPAMFCREMGTFAHFPDMREYGSSGLSDGRGKQFYGRAVRMEFSGNGIERRKGARPGKAGAEKCPGFFFGLYRAFPKAYVVRADQVRVVAVPVFGPG